MSKWIVLDELHLTISIPPRLPQATQKAIVRTLRRRVFKHALHEALEKLLRRYPSLRRIQFKIER